MSPFNPILMSKRSLGGSGNLPCFRCMLPLCHMKVDSTSIPSLGVEGVKLTGCFFFFFIFFIFFFFIIIQISFRRFSIANLQGSVRWNCLILWFWVFFSLILLLSYRWMTSQHMYVLCHSQKWLCHVQSIFDSLFFKQTRSLLMVLKWNHGQDRIHTICYINDFSHTFLVCWLVSKITSSTFFRYFNIGITLLKHIGFLQLM